MGSTVLGAVAGGTLLALAATPALAGNYVYTTIASPGSIYTQALGVNDLDQVVGTVSENGFKSQRAFIWSAGSFTYVNATPADPGGRTVLVAIDERGEAVGSYQLANGAQEKPIIVRAGTLRKPDFGGLVGLQIAGLSQNGLIAGSAYFNNERGPFTYRAGVVTPLALFPGVSTTVTAINDRGDIVGLSGSSLQGTQGFLYSTAGQLSQIAAPNASTTVPLFIDAAGVIGGYYFVGSKQQGFVRQVNGTFKRIDAPVGPGGRGTSVISVGSGGQVFGEYRDGSNYSHAFAYTNGVYHELLPPGAAGVTIYGVNAKSSIVGTYVTGGVTTGFIATCPGAPGSCAD